MKLIRIRSLVVVLTGLGVAMLSAAPTPEASRGSLNAGGSSQTGGEWRNLGAIGEVGGATARGAGIANFGGFLYTLPPLADGDMDGDGLLDAWDPDNDPVPSTAERVLDAGSVRLTRSLPPPPETFQITSIQWTALGVRLTWAAEPNRTYRVLRLAHAGDGLPTAQPVATVTVGAAGAAVTAVEGVAFDGDRTPDSGGFYRIEWVP